MAVLRRLVAAACFGGLIVVCCAALAATEGPTAGKSDKPAARTAPVSVEKLSTEQQRVADSFHRLEEELFRMGEVNATTDPRRAALAKKVVEESKKREVDLQFKGTVDLLKKNQLSHALETQAEIQQHLQALLQLLQSEDEAKLLEAKKQQIRQYLKQINDLIKQQQGAQGETAGGGNMKQLAGQQKGIAAKAGRLAEDMRTAEPSKEGVKTEPKGNEKADGKGQGKGQGKNEAKGEGKGQGKSEAKGEGKGQGKGEGKGQGKGQGKGEGKGEGKGKGQGKGEGKGQGKGQGKGEGQGEENQAEANPSEQDQSQSDARKHVEAARKEMEEAQRKLDDAKREGAVEKQQKAVDELTKAKAKLEEILRQMREEEIERRLAMLEARFRKMLQLQIEVYEGTVLLDKVPKPQRTANHQIESSRLGAKETAIVIDVDWALRLLKEDGTAVALPEAVQQIREDMLQVVHRLGQARTEEITQAIEKDIITALQEIIDTLKKEQKERDPKSKPSRPSPSGEPPTPPLVDTLAELKMIRALQMRVNGRTERYRRLIVGEQAEQADLFEALQRLGQQEERIHDITRDIELGKNR